MATFQQLISKIASLPVQVRRVAPTIIAQTATAYYRDRFRKKEWNGRPWKPAKYHNSRGSLMVRSGALQSTIRAVKVSPDEVIIRAGSDKVPYARIHNEGGTIKQKPTAKQRRFFWAQSRNATGADIWKNAARAKEIHIPIPRRQFIGKSPELNKQINTRLKAIHKRIFK